MMTRARLWSRLVAASQLVGSRDHSVAELTAVSSTTKLTTARSDLTGTLADSEKAAILVEECHLLRSAEGRELLGRFLGLLPPVVRVVMLSRSDPGLRLGRLRVEARLADMRAPELAFTLGETAAVLAVSNITLSDDTLQELFRLTEGWPAAVALAALSLVQRPGRSEAEEFVHRLSGSDRLASVVISPTEPHSASARLLEAGVLFSLAVADCLLAWERGGSMNGYRIMVIIAIVAALLGLGVARAVWSDEAVVAPMEPVPVATPIPVVVADEPAPEPMTMQSVWDGQNRETRNVICGYFLAQPGPTLDQLVSAGNGMFTRDVIMIFLEEKCR